VIDLLNFEDLFQQSNDKNNSISLEHNIHHFQIFSPIVSQIIIFNKLLFLQTPGQLPLHLLIRAHTSSPIIPDLTLLLPGPKNIPILSFELAFVFELVVFATQVVVILAELVPIVVLRHVSIFPVLLLFRVFLEVDVFPLGGGLRDLVVRFNLRGFKRWLQIRRSIYCYLAGIGCQRIGRNLRIALRTVFAFVAQNQFDQLVPLYPPGGLHHQHPPQEVLGRPAHVVHVLGDEQRLLVDLVYQPLDRGVLEGTESE